MNSAKSSVSGFSLLSILAALVVLGILYVGVQGLNRVSGDVKQDLVAAPSGSRKTACVMNRQAVSRALLTWTVTHPGRQATIKDLRNSGITVPACPEGGKFSIRGDSIHCSIHDEKQQ